MAVVPLDHVRPAAVAGLFYPEQAAVLSTTIKRLLASALPPQEAACKALIVPHAGLLYSGPIAASAYASIYSQRQQIRRVVLLGPCHKGTLAGLALPQASHFATPLGQVPLARQRPETLAQLTQVRVNAAAHATEHALEVQLPFLQTLLGDFELVPLLVGQASAAEVAAVLEALWGGPETLTVISSDLSHQLNYTRAQQQDQQTVARILQHQPLSDTNLACGATAINGLTLLAQRYALETRLLDQRNSGDTAGERSQVVGYAAISFSEPCHVIH